MAKSLKLTIELAGAEEIKRQLEGVGVAGEEAFNKIVDAAKQTGSFKELDPSFLKKTFDDLGTKAPEAIGKITQAVRSAGRMETLVNGLTSIENGLGGIQRAASAVDGVLGRALMPSLMRIGRLLPAAFAAGVVGSIANTTKALLDLNKAAIQAGVSIAELGKTQEVFKQLGFSTSEAAKQAGDFVEKMNLDAVKQSIEDTKKTIDLTFPSFDLLRKAAEGFGPAADMARDFLQSIGKLDTALSPAAKAIADIAKSQDDSSQKMLQMLTVFEKMGETSARNGLMFKTFSKDVATAAIEMLDAGISIDEIRTALANLEPPSKEAAAAAIRLGLAWQRAKNFFMGFKASPEVMNAIRASIDQVIAGMTRLGEIAASVNKWLLSFFSGDLFGNTMRELQTIVTLFGYIRDGAVAVWNAIVLAAQTAVQAILQFFQEMPGKILGFFAGLGTNLWDGIVTTAKSAWETITGYIQAAINKAKEFFRMGGGKASGAGAQAMARGGMIGGRGSGTSDSNLAWVSRGEHIMPAYAVRQPGVLQLLEALRRSGGNLRGVLDRMGHFAMGGMVRAPAFAGGGALGGMSNVTIQFPGVQPITGLRASSAVVDELRRSAALAQVRSGGRKPTRYI